MAKRIALDKEDRDILKKQLQALAVRVERARVITTPELIEISNAMARIGSVLIGYGENASRLN